MNTLAISMPGGWEWLVIAVVGLLIFGRRLPEVGRSLGKGIVEFKKGLKGIEEEVDKASDAPSSAAPSQGQAQLREPQRWEGQPSQVSKAEQPHT
jgi:sec-independent protein translocase protein TatA